MSGSSLTVDFAPETAGDPIARAEAVMAAAFQRFDSRRIAISFSGAEDVALIELATRVCDDFRVFSLDTGRLHPETYQYLETVREHYGIEIELAMPEADAVQALVREKGLFSFYRDGHQECCNLRKIEPLRRQLSQLDAWITGQRRDQGVTRLALEEIEDDQAFGTAEHPIVKFNPLAGVDSATLWAFLREQRVPYNPLHAAGYVSIGCQPCTRPVAPHEPERSGRWWWEQEDGKECGLHAQNVRPVKIVG